MERLSVVLITYNEEHNIDRCLASVRWADEIVVVDSFSRDSTVERAKQYTEKVFQHEYLGSTRQMERGIGYATGDWIFLIDADEELSSELKAEIQQVLREGSDKDGYEFIRKPWAFGRWIEHGGWFPDRQFRFFRRDRYILDHQEVHGGFRTSGPRGQLNGYVYHYTYPTIYAYAERMNDYTSLYVSNKLKQTPVKRIRWWHLIVNPLSHFLRMFISLKAYKDGFHGFVLSLLDANYSMLLYAKLWEYQMRQREGEGHLPPITNAELNVLKRRK